MLQLMAKLSKLFSDNKTPYLDYRIAENLFCRYYSAMNDARSCTAYDARLSHVGIGIKTFILSGKNGDFSNEKVAEFNKLKPTLDGLGPTKLMRQLAQYRNDRMRMANDMYDVNESIYHIVGRMPGNLRLFNTPYEEIDIEHLHLTKDDERTCNFNDEKNEYTFNKSKSVLIKRFIVPQEYKDISVEIFEEPLDLLEQLVTKTVALQELRPQSIRGYDYVILPLYSYSRKKGYFVPEKSGLNQFNAGGRKRNDLEVYIPVPKNIHTNFPDFFPSRNIPFALYLPDGKCLSAKICQDGEKALMSNPNKDLGEWILRKVLKKGPRELVTMEDLDRLGFNSICVKDLHSVNKDGQKEYSLTFSADYEDYKSFIEASDIYGI